MEKKLYCTRTCLTAITALLISVLPVLAMAPYFINYQGYLTDSGGASLDTTVDITYRIYHDHWGGPVVWDGIVTTVVTNGYFEAILGMPPDPLSPDIFNDESMFLGLTVGEDSEMFPLIPFAAVPYAYRVATVDSATGGAITSQVFIADKANIGENNLNAGLNTFVAGQSNNASGNYSVVSGGQSNAAHNGYTTIGGGQRNHAVGRHSVICGGEGNWAIGYYSTIVGGDTNSTGNQYTFVGGGYDNTASGYASTTTGGFHNSARGQYAFVGGGGGSDLADSNSAKGDYSAIAGGTTNTVHEDYGTIGGGSENKVWGTYSFIGGGQMNADSGASCGTIAGGYYNSVIHNYAAVGGGSYNKARGLYSVVPGGRDNLASGEYSFAAGRRAKANYNGSWVWADGINQDFPSTNYNQFNVRSSGGVRIFTDSSATIGVSLYSNDATWNSVSDRNRKTGFREVNTAEILDKVAALPIQRWHYKIADPSVEHIGPMAQDFYAAFGLGVSDTTISTIDPDGVALAAIQELAKQNAELKDRIEHLEQIILQMGAQVNENTKVRN